MAKRWGLRYEIMQQPKSLGRKLLSQKRNAVRLPPGLFRLGTKPCLTGPPAMPNTTGIVVVAACAALVDRTNLAASSRSRPGWFSANR
jgi:hypothetical protein